VPVDRGGLLDQRVDVGDRDEDPHRTVRQLLRDGQLVEVHRVVVVDRHPQRVAQVAETRDGLVRCGLVELGCLGERGVREIRLQRALQHRPARDAAEIDPGGPRARPGRTLDSHPCAGVAHRGRAPPAGSGTAQTLV